MFTYRIPTFSLVLALCPCAQVVAKQTLILTVTLDHRFADGSQISRCGKLLQHYLENPGDMENQ